MNALQMVIEDMNFWPRITGQGTEIPFPPRPEHFKQIRQHIECSLSPENLHMDGEASMAHVRREYTKLHTAWDLLADMDGNTAEPYV